VLPAVRNWFYLLRPLKDCVTLKVPHVGLRQHKLFAKNIKNCSIFGKNHQDYPHFHPFFTFTLLIFPFPFAFCSYAPLSLCLLKTPEGCFQSKTLTLKNKNKIFPKFLSLSIITTYGL
jgi:hypothetical protein